MFPVKRLRKKKNLSLRIKSKTSLGQLVKKRDSEKERECQGENKLSWKVQEGGWRVGKRRDNGEEERGREQRKLREFDAPFLSVKWHCYSQGSEGGRLIGRWRDRRHRIDCRFAT